MKKTLIALAALAAAGAASAQSSVTLFGIVDVAATYGKGTGNHKWSATSGSYNTSRIGLRGVEDLGGGLSASFWLEAQFQADDGTGTATNTNNQPSGTPIAGTATSAPAGSAPLGGQGLTFNRRSTVSLAGNFGEIRLGRDYVPQFWNNSVFDPFGIVGVGASLQHVGRNGVLANSTAARASNSFGYFLPNNLGGLYGQVQYYLGDQNSTVASNGSGSKDGSGYGLRLGYAAGPLDVAAAYGRTQYTTGVTAGPTAGSTTQLPFGDVKTANIGASWNFGVAKIMASYNRDKFGVGDRKLTGWVVGGSVPVGVGEIRASYSVSKLDGGSLPGYGVTGAGTGRANKLALGYVHNLSKRTAVYTTIARLKNKDGAAFALGAATATAANGNATGFDLGIRHSF